MKEKNARNAAAEALLHVAENEGYSNIVIDKTIRSYGLSGVDSAFCSALFYGVLEKRLFLDRVLKQYAAVPAEKMDAPVREILRCGVYQLYFMDKVPDSAAVNEAVKSVKAFQGSRASGFVNGVLRHILRAEKKVSLPEEPDERLSVEYSPDFD